MLLSLLTQGRRQQECFGADMDPRYQKLEGVSQKVQIPCYDGTFAYCVALTH